MCGLYCLTDVLPVSLADLTYDLSVRAHDGTSIGGIGTLLGPTNVHLQCTINTVNYIKCKDTLTKNYVYDSRMDSQNYTYGSTCKMDSKLRTLVLVFLQSPWQWGRPGTRSGLGSKVEVLR